MKKPRRTITQRSSLISDFHFHGINPDTREIILMSNPENDEDGIDWTCANTFIKNLLLLNSQNHQPILVHQCTDGGEWDYGIAIFDAILTSPSPITVLIHACAYSMASIIPQAAKKRVIMPNANFMLHFGTSSFDGDDRSFVAEGKQAERIGEVMLNIYAQRCVKGPFFRRNKYPKDRVKEYLRLKMNTIREWYMSAQQATDLGFVDGVFGTVRFKTYKDLR